MIDGVGINYLNLFIIQKNKQYFKLLLQPKNYIMLQKNLK